MIDVLLVLLLVLALDVAAVQWGADSRRLDPSRRPPHALGSPRGAAHR